MVQQLFSHMQGVRYLATLVQASNSLDVVSVAASTTCQDEPCTKLAFKVSRHRCWS